MECPLCKKEMKQLAVETFTNENPMIMAEMQECECGFVYQYYCGAERFIKDGKEIVNP